MYIYKKQKKKLLTEDGQKNFIKSKDLIMKHIKESGAVMIGPLMKDMAQDDIWEMIAVFDMMVELGDLKEISLPNRWGQHRVFIENR